MMQEGKTLLRYLETGQIIEVWPNTEIRESIDGEPVWVDSGGWDYGLVKLGPPWGFEFVSTAEWIFCLLDGNTQAYETKDGKTLDQLCREHGAMVEQVERPEHGGITRYLFEDGSAVVDRGQVWDIEGVEQ